MTTLREAAAMALDALEWCEPAGTVGYGGVARRSAAITALREALAAPMPEPIGHLHSNGEWCQVRAPKQPLCWPIDLYAAPPAAPADEIAALRAEVAGLRADAERYRWLRDPHNQDCHSVGKCAPDIERYEAIDWLYGDELDVSIDAAIDAARKGEA